MAMSWRNITNQYLPLDGTFARPRHSGESRNPVNTLPLDVQGGIKGGLESEERACV